MSLLPSPIPRLLSKFDRQPVANKSSGLYSSRQSCSGRSSPRRSWRRGCRQGRQSTTCLLAGNGRLPFGGSPVRVYEVTKAPSKRVVAEALVHAPVEQVWAVLTDYDKLAGFVPNLESCKRLPSPKPGRVWVAQRACSQSLLWRLEAEAVLEVEEIEEPDEGEGMGRREARFSQVQGDFKELSGRWVVEPCGMACMLRYDVTVVPKQDVPFMLVNHIVRAGLPSNILAVAQRAEQLAAERLKPPSIASWALEDDAPIPDRCSLEDQPPRPQLQQGDAGPPACVFSLPPELDGCSIDGVEKEGSGPCATPSMAGPSQPAGSAGAAAAAAAAVAPPWPSGGEADESLPSCGPFWSFKSRFAAAAPITAEAQRARLGRSASAASAPTLPTSYLGVVSVPLPPAGSRGGQLEQDLQATMNERQRQKEILQSSYPAFGLGRPGTLASSPSLANGSSIVNSSGGSSSGSGLSGSRRASLAAVGSAGSAASALPVSPADAALAEVHLRRLDGLDYLHRRAVAAITIDAPPEEVWAVLTDYDRLAEFVPNLAVSQRIKLPPGAPPNVVRVRQVGYKRMLYMSMHAESVMDLVEKPFSEIQFRQVAGDFERFQGKWMLSECVPTDPEATGVGTQLKYAVEIVIPRAARLLGVMEPILERCVFEDMPANLWAVKRRVEWAQNDRARTAQLQRIEELEAAGESAKAAALRKRLERPRQQELIEDFSVLAAELERCFGEQRYLPSRAEFREMGRYDLDKAVTAHGGPAAVAQALGWGRWGGKQRNRKPRGYWDSLDNVRAAIDEFNAEFGLQPGTMPAKMDLRRAGRKDIEKALEKWGGLYAVAEELGYEVGGGWVGHLRDVATTTGLAGNQGLFKEAAKTYKKLDASRDEESAREAALASLILSSGGSSLSSMDALSSLDAFSGSSLIEASASRDSSSNGGEGGFALAGVTRNANAAAAANGGSAPANGAAVNGAAANGSGGAKLTAGQPRQMKGARAGSKAAAAALAASSNGGANGSSTNGNGRAAKAATGGSRSGSSGRRKGADGKGVRTLGSVRDEIDSW